MSEQKFFNKHANEFIWFQCKNFNRNSKEDLNEANKKTTFKLGLEDYFMSKNILHYIAAKICPTNSTEY